MTTTKQPDGSLLHTFENVEELRQYLLRTFGREVVFIARGRGAQVIANVTPGCASN